MKQECLDALRKQEELLRFERFDSAEALAVGNAAASLASEYDRDICVAVVRERDGVMLFQYAMDSITPDNLQYMEAKRRAVRLTGHSSLWPYVEYSLTGKWRELIEKVPEVLPAGGAFPIFVDNEWTATLMVSGLHDGKDYELAVRALSFALGVEVPVIPGKMI